MSSAAEGQFDPLSWFMPKAPEYTAYLATRQTSANIYLPALSLSNAIWLAAVFTALRAIFNTRAVRWVTRLFPQSAISASDAHKLEEEMWGALGSTVIVLAGWWCVLFRNWNCALGNVGGCFAGWPLLPTNTSLQQYYILELGWYLHLIFKHIAGVGLQDRGAMLGHHFATMSLIVVSHVMNLQHIGTLSLTIMNTSTPLLHLSKVANALKLRQAKVALFGTFAASFFAARIVCFAIILEGTFVQSLYTIPDILTTFVPMYAITNALMGGLFILQIIWMATILKILKQAVAGNEAAVSKAARSLHVPHKHRVEAVSQAL